MSFNYHVINQNAVVLNFDGKIINVTRKTFEKFGELLALLKAKDLDAIKLLFEQKAEGEYQEFIPNTGLKLIGTVLVDSDSETLPVNLSNKIIELHKDGWDVTNLINFWKNVKENPSRNSREQLYRFLCDNQHPITDDGHFIAYRNVTKGFRDHHTGRFDNSVGQVLEMPRRDVNDDHTVGCSYGFHVAKFSYASTFKSNGILISVKVNPRDAVAVPKECSGEKMRVCRFEVMEVIEQRLDGVDFTNAWTATPLIEEEKRDDWGDIVDDYERADEYTWFVDKALDAARYHKEKYSDIAYLAVRVSEFMEDEFCWDYDHDQSPAGILKVLTQNKDKW